jgi:hypothetical protein
MAGTRQLDDGVDPLGLGVGAGFQRAHAARLHLAQDVADVARLLVEHVLEVGALPDCWVVITNSWGSRG